MSYSTESRTWRRWQHQQLQRQLQKVPDAAAGTADRDTAGGDAGAVDPDAAPQEPAAEDPSRDLHKRIGAARTRGEADGQKRGRAELLRALGIEDEGNLAAIVEAGRRALEQQQATTEQSAVAKLRAEHDKKIREIQAETARLQAIADRAVLVGIGRKYLDDVVDAELVLARYGVGPQSVTRRLAVVDGVPVVQDDQGATVAEGEEEVGKFLRAEKARAANLWWQKPVASGRPPPKDPAPKKPSAEQGSNGRPRSVADSIAQRIEELVAQKS